MVEESGTGRRYIGRLDIRTSLTGGEAGRFLDALEKTGLTQYGAAKAALALWVEKVEHDTAEGSEDPAVLPYPADDLDDAYRPQRGSPGLAEVVI